MAVSRRLRYEVLRRDNHACRYCGATAPDVALTVDHVIPVALGGTDDPSNLVTACQPCNAGKSASSPDAPIVADVAADALRWSKAMTAASDVMRKQRVKRDRDREYFVDLWLAHYGNADDLPDVVGPSIDDFVAAGLTWGDLDDAVEISAQYYRRDPWRYFCGICWNKVSAMQTMARQLLEQEERPDGA